MAVSVLGKYVLQSILHHGFRSLFCAGLLVKLLSIAVWIEISSAQKISFTEEVFGRVKKLPRAVFLVFSIHIELLLFVSVE